MSECETEGERKREGDGLKEVYTKITLYLDMNYNLRANYNAPELIFILTHSHAHTSTPGFLKLEPKTVVIYTES